MGYYAGFKYGTGILYGIQCSIGSVDPIRGPSPGGNRFVITGDGFDPRHWDDLFTDPSLDAGKWSDISSGGSVYTGPDHLRMSTGVSAGSSAGVKSSAGWGHTQGEVRIVLDTPVVFPRVNPVVICRYCLWVSDSTYACIIITMDSEGRLELNCETWVGGKRSDARIEPIPWSFGTSTLKILRWGSDVYFIANGSVIFNTVKFTDAQANFAITCENLEEEYDVNTLKVEWFYFRPYAVFQNQPVHDTVVVSNKRVRGLVPASKDIRGKDAAFKGFVDVSMVANFHATADSAYEYYYVKGLKTINDPQFDTVMDIVNDPQLETPEGEPKGLGGGY